MSRVRVISPALFLSLIFLFNVVCFFAGLRTGLVYCMIFDNIKVLVLSLQSQDRGTVGIDTLGVFCTGCSNQSSDVEVHGDDGLPPQGHHSKGLQVGPQ
jgi:hypothetical protein